MKPLIIAGLLVFSMLGSACNKQDDSTSGPQELSCSYGSSYYLEAKIAGKNWCSNASLTGVLTNVMTITATADDSTLMRLTINDLSPGTYPIGMTRNVIEWRQDGEAYYPATNNAGTLVITNHDVNLNTIEGTFLVTLQNSTSVTRQINNGKFSLTYTE